MLATLICIIIFYFRPQYEMISANNFAYVFNKKSGNIVTICGGWSCKHIAELKEL